MFDDLFNSVICSGLKVFTWGHRLVTPRRVLIARSLKKSGSALMKFHRWERLHVVGIAAGMVHSMALTDDGTLFYWVSSDPDLKCQQVNIQHQRILFFDTLAAHNIC